MYGVNEDRYWLQVQARYEHWYDEDDEDNGHSNVRSEWDEADDVVDELLLANHR